MKETIFYNEWNEPEAVRVSLDDVKLFLLQIDNTLDVTVHFEDYDEYGCKHYLVIHGKKADIVFEKNFGGMFCPTDCLDCEIKPHVVRDKNTRLIGEYCFKNEPKQHTIGQNYEKRIKEYIERYMKFLGNDENNELFEFLTMEQIKEKNAQLSSQDGMDIYL